ncbi:MAG: exodeoxyribonuclease VII large subunit [Candidatus Delongbacteria bacterium]
MSPTQRSRPDPDRVWPLHELAREFSARLEEDWPPLWVQGEISGLKLHAASGHRYFTLKDERSQFPAVLWRSRLAPGAPEPRDGQRVEALVQLVFYGPQGRLQLDVQRLRGTGQGELLQAFLELKERLAREGLFDPARKRPLPAYPRHIGLLTSESGAALQDMLKVFRRRWPGLRCSLLPVPVQGPQAGPALARGLQRLAAWPGLELDLIILGRGGGSFEDLYCFNDEALLRAIATCPLPVVSAVGHEIDTPLSDLAADLRAPTPTAAAELCVPDLIQVLERVERDGRRLTQSLRLRLERENRRLRAARTHRALAEPLRRFHETRQALDEQGQSLRAALSGRLGRSEEGLRAAQRRLRGALERGQSGAATRLQGWPRRLATLAARLGREAREREERQAARLDPLLRRRLEDLSRRLAEAGRGLERLEAGRLAALALRLGFARVRDEDGRPVERAGALQPGQRIELGFQDGRARARVDEISKEDA